MCSKRFLVLGGMIAGLVAAAVPIAAEASARSGASGPSVTVRVEGLNRALLEPSTLRTRTGWITRFGAPTGKCPASSGAGALDAATKHRWAGSYSTSFGDYEITSILGEAHTFSSKDYWEIFVNNVAASKGACEIPLRRGVQLMFAAVPDKGTEYPLALRAPRSARVGKTFDATVVWFNAKGKAEPLAGATVSISGRRIARTDGHGVIPLTPSHAGTFLLDAEHAGYIRAATVTLRVT